LAKDCGADLGMQIQWLPTGGCCDGNNLAAAGIPNIDTLGVQGGKIHSADEYVKVSSFTKRAKLSALMLMKLATSDDLGWLGVQKEKA
ncbi:M20/M25/M40 family metallo-hydrolase, partial [Oceanospirillum sp. HFRX-1_2]